VGLEPIWIVVLYQNLILNHDDNDDFLFIRHKCNSDYKSISAKRKPLDESRNGLRERLQSES
jgi:hypothetical protein